MEHRLKTLMDVGLGYLTLNRLANSLRWGEKPADGDTSLGSNTHQFIVYGMNLQSGLRIGKAIAVLKRTARPGQYCGGG